MVGLGIMVFDATQLVGIVLRGIRAGELDSLVAECGERFVHSVRIEALELEICFCPRDEVREHFRERVQAFEIHIGDSFGLVCTQRTAFCGSQVQIENGLIGP